MHPISMNLMKDLLEEEGILKDGKILDVGSANINGTYRSLFDPLTSYTGVDMSPGNGVDIVLSDPYVLPFPDRSFNLVISGQTFEHAEFFWELFLEMVRVTDVGGALIIIAPSAGHVHRYPSDCWRFYPDSWNALAKYASKKGMPVRLGKNGILATYWRDSYGVFYREA